jgi:type I restriction enzyme S subunit
MTTKLQTYDNYKPSGVEWLGEIPEHWESIRMKRLFKDYSEKNRPNEVLMSVTQNQGVVPRTWVENRMVMPSGALESFKFIEKGDFAISLRSFEGGLEYCHHNGIISPAYTVLKIDSKKLYADFYKYLFKSKAFISELQTSIVGIREGKNISYPELSYSFLPIPSVKEQTTIALFLDDKTTKIDQAIGIKQKQIELLKERRQILIHKAVTRGLNDTVKLKDSGVEWIGEIPESWEVKALKFISNLQSGEFISSEDFKEEGYPIYGGNGFRGFSEKYTNDGFYALIGRQGALCGNVNYAEGKFYATEHAIVVYPLNSENVLWLGETIKIANFNRLSQSAAQPGIAVGVIKNERFPYPPKNEQTEIAEYIETATTKIANAISLKEQEIEKLKEYKMSLIDGVVTGKVRVC